MRGYVYGIRMVGLEQFVKIGSTIDFEKRLTQAMTYCPTNYIVDFLFYIERPTDIERRMHDLLSDKRANGEWFMVHSEQVYEAANMACEWRTEDLDETLKFAGIKGEGNARSVLSKENVREIKTLIARGAKTKWIADTFDVGYTTIYNIKSGKTWKHIQA